MLAHLAEAQEPLQVELHVSASAYSLPYEVQQPLEVVPPDSAEDELDHSHGDVVADASYQVGLVEQQSHYEALPPLSLGDGAGDSRGRC